MSNAQFLSPWPNIAKKIENSYYCVPYENDVLGPVSPNLLLGPRGVGNVRAGWYMPPKVLAEYNAVGRCITACPPNFR